MKFDLSVVQTRAGEFEQHVLDISTPGHTYYGKHLTRDAVQAFLQPEQNVITKIIDWLASQGVRPNDVTLGPRNWLSFQTSLLQAERLLNTTFHYYHNEASNTTSIRTLQYSVPHFLREHVQLIHPTTHFDGRGAQASIFMSKKQFVPPPPMFPSGYKATFCNKTITPACLRGVYGMETDGGYEKVKLGISLSSGSQMTFYSTAPTPAPQCDVLNMLNYLLELPDDQIPMVLSISSGKEERDMSRAHANATCSLFAQLGARGTSVIVASGGSSFGSACHSNNSTLGLPESTTRFVPMFPASCPFVTSVGATQQVEPEIAASFSSGGFSDIFARPAYQDAAVERFLDQLGSQWDGLYNPAGRGFPDVSAQGVNFVIRDRGHWKNKSGTSYSAPTFAAVVANLNALLMTAARPPLGFLNPFIYGHGIQGFTDIFNGDSTDCTAHNLSSGGVATPYVQNASWYAVPGWDPVTGLGTPIVPKLAKLMFESPHLKGRIPGSLEISISEIPSIPAGTDGPSSEYLNNSLVIATSSDIEDAGSAVSRPPQSPLRGKAHPPPIIGAPPSFRPQPTDNAEVPCWRDPRGRPSCVFGAIPTKRPSLTTIVVIPPQITTYTPTIFDPHPSKTTSLTVRPGPTVTVTVTEWPTTESESSHESFATYTDRATWTETVSWMEDITWIETLITVQSAAPSEA